MRKPIGAFEGFGIEAEYMIVDKETLNPSPSAENVLRALNGGELSDEVERGEVAWSNELVSHVVEIKCAGPAKTLKGLDETFHASIQDVLGILDPLGLTLLPTAMHPWMDPLKETVLWPHGQKEIYQKYNEIFGCQGHGWANVQSVHINLPYANEEEFGRLHAAIRACLPVIPFLAASSPWVEGKISETADARLGFYEKNQIKIPSVTGSVVPEPVFTFEDYHKLLEGIYQDISPYDPQGLLAHQWLNSRGAIAKFDVQAIEIRIMDIQESPKMDMALVAFICEMVKHVHCGEQGPLRSISTETLRDIYNQAKGYGNFELPLEYLSLFGCHSPANINEFLGQLLTRFEARMPESAVKGVGLILEQGNLSKRIRSRKAQSLQEVYSELAVCLKNNSFFQLA